MKTYIAIIGDLINSRSISDRELFQENLIKTLNEINTKYKKSIVTKFTLTLGDEFQAILNLDHNLMKIIDELFVNIKCPFRMGIGYGEIITKIDPNISIGADGSAYWRARKAIDYVYNNNYQDRCNIYFIGEQEADSTVNTLFLLTETVKYQWTNLQKETFELMFNDGIYDESFNQQLFAKKINISQSSLSKRLSSGNIKIYLHGRNELMKFMEKNYD